MEIELINIKEIPSDLLVLREYLRHVLSSAGGNPVELNIPEIAIMTGFSPGVIGAKLGSLATRGLIEIDRRNNVGKVILYAITKPDSARKSYEVRLFRLKEKRALKQSAAELLSSKGIDTKTASG